MAAHGGGLWCCQCLVVEKPWRFDNGERAVVMKENISFTKNIEKEGEEVCWESKYHSKLM